MSPPDKTFKLQPFLLQSEFDLAEVDPVTITLQKRAYRPLAPLNLRVAGDGYNPTYGTGAEIVADWDKAANRSSEDPVTKVLSPDIDKTVLEVLTTGDVLKGTFEFSGGAGPKTITNAQLIAALGSETDFNPSSRPSIARGASGRTKRTFFTPAVVSRAATTWQGCGLIVAAGTLPRRSGSWA